MTRRLLSLLTITTALVAPAGASAADKTLLSGYGGPGSGEQSLLGGALLPAARGDGSLRAAAPPAGGSPQAAPVPAGGTPATSDRSPATGGAEAATDRPATASGPATKKQNRPAAGKSHGDGNARGTSEAARAKPAAAGQVASAQTVSYPAANEAGSLPAGSAELAFILLGLTVLVATGVLTRSLGRSHALRPDSALR